MEWVIDYLTKKQNELSIQLINFNLEKNGLRATGKFRKIGNIDYAIAQLTNRVNSSELIITFVKNLKFINNTDSIRECLSPYGVFCDRTNFWYNEDVLNKYSTDYKIQIVMCEVFNSLQDYFMAYNPKKGKNYRGRSLTCLYGIGLIDEAMALYKLLYRSKREEDK